MTDILIVIPPYYYKTKVLTSSVKEYAGVAFLAAVLRKNGYTVEILDADLAGFGIEQTVKEIDARKAKIIGFTVLQVAAQVCVDIIKQIRLTNAEAHITIGGHFPSFAIHEIFDVCQEIDSIVVGEGEYTFLELADTLNRGEDWRSIKGIAYRSDGLDGKVIMNDPRPLISDLDDLPFQARDTLGEVLARGGPASIITSRGCYGNCAFCSVNAFYKLSPGNNWRARSPEHIGEELEWIVKQFNTHIFVFNDDNFFGPGKYGKDRAYKIGEEIMKRKLEIYFAIPSAVNDVDKDLFRFLKNAGLRSVFLGVESMIQSDLDFLHKHTTVEQNEIAIRILEEIGLFYQLGYIMFYPYSTLEQLKYNITYLKEKIINNPYCGTQVFTGELKVLHGTKLMRVLEDQNILKKERFHYHYEIQDHRVEQLRYLTDNLVMSKTFPLMTECKEDFMGMSTKRIIRTLICNTQLSMLLDIIEYLEKVPTIPPVHLKTMVRKMNDEVKILKQKIQVIQSDQG